jgi:hypothetical protein
MLSENEGMQTYQQGLLNKVLSDKSLTQVSEYFRFYLIQAMYHTGNANMYPGQLKIWANYLDQGFTTIWEGY